MSNKALKILLSFILLFVLTIAVSAQKQTGSISGKVADTEEAPLPGASVTLSGPALMGTLTYLTTPGGDFRFPSVPPGRDYVITVEMAAFQKVIRGNIIVHVGKTVTLMIELEPSAIQEEITVMAAVPAIDIKSSKISVNYSEDMITNIPLQRDFYDIIETAPGTVSDLWTFHRSFSSHGSTMRNNQVSLDGINTDSPLTGTNMAGLPFDIFDELEIEVGSHPAEVGMTDGAYVNIVSKSGGNDFQGQASAYYFNKKMIQNLIPDSKIEAVGLAKPTGYKNWSDYSFSLGGPIIKDKLWFFLNLRYADWILEEESYAEGPVEVTHAEIMTFVKLSFKPNPSLRFTGMWSFGNWDDSHLIDLGYKYYDSIKVWPYVDNDQNHTILALANWILNQNTFFDLRLNYLRRFMPWRTHPNLPPDTPWIAELSNGGLLGAWRFNEDYTTERFQMLLSGTHFVDDFLAGNHEIKAGVEYERSKLRHDMYKQTPYLLFTYQGLPWALHNTVPYMGMFNAFLTGANKGDTIFAPELRRFSAYIQDSYTFKGRLTLNLGLRYDESHGDVLGGTFKPSGRNDPVLTMLAPNVFREHTLQDMKNVAVWKDFSPRIGAVFDFFGDGTTSIRTSWARYNEYLIHHITGMALPTSPERAMSTLWLDMNQNGIIETSDIFIPQSKPPDPLTYNLDDHYDPNLKSPIMNEFIVGMERKLFKDFSVGVSYLYKWKHRIVTDVDNSRGYTADSEWWLPYTITEPGWDGQYGTADDAQITVYGVRAGAPESQLFITNPEEAERKYRALEFIFKKRMSNRWQLLGSVTWSKFEGNIGTAFLETFPDGPAFNDPNWSVNRYGRLTHDRPLSIKLQGSVLLPFDLMLSGFFFHMSGIPWARTLRIQLPFDPAFENPGGTVDIYGAADGRSLGINAEAPGSRRSRSRNNLDLRIEKIISIGSLGRLGIFLDVLNAFGESWFDVDQDPGGIIHADGSFEQWPTYGKFMGANGMRTFKASARFTF